MGQRPLRKAGDHPADTEKASAIELSSWWRPRGYLEVSQPVSQLIHQIYIEHPLCALSNSGVFVSLTAPRSNGRGERRVGKTYKESEVRNHDGISAQGESHAARIC